MPDTFRKTMRRTILVRWQYRCRRIWRCRHRVHRPGRRSRRGRSWNRWRRRRVGWQCYVGCSIAVFVFKHSISFECAKLKMMRSGERRKILGSLLIAVVQLVDGGRSEEHTSELQSHSDLVCRLLLEKK